MSGLLYPDNQNRGNRVEQLTTQIGFYQNSFESHADAVERTDDRTQSEVAQVLRLLGFSTIEELEKQLLQKLTPQQRKEYLEMVEHMRKVERVTENILTSSSIVAFIAASTGALVRPIATILNTGSRAATTNLFTRGAIQLLRGNVTQATRYMQTAMRTFRNLSNNPAVGLSPGVARVVKVFRAASTVLTVFGIVLDGLLLVFAAIQGARQREELQRAIRELVARRFQVQDNDAQIGATRDHVALINAFIVTYRSLKSAGMTDEEMRPTLSILLGNINDSLNTELDRIDDNLVWELGRSLDRNTPNAWLNEDPSLRQTLDFIESQPEMAAQAAAELTIQTKYQIEKANDISSAPGHKNSHGYPNDLKKNPDLALVPGQTTESITMVQGSDHQGRPVIAKIQIHLSVQDIEVKLI